ncbi:ABC transporter ATP-binding protein [Pelagibacterium montanilacus]|uniref:ABC transporter ATP-binding protein n=1 Tax=Pelagibacterium montanilacus TaxID=2185280 RepID=UPI000F8D4D48|nr:ABC transporter ATP-binding protein [Pelagibacterium montanilacus]
MSGVLLELDRLAMGFGDLAVIEEITMHLARGEFVSILGPSGSGKSTLFKLLLGEHRPASGTIALAGGGDRRSAFAYMPQRDALMAWRRIIDNITLGLELAGMSRRTARRKVVPMLGRFGLEGFERSYPDQLSGGMRQRAALLRTIVQDRPILLLDEPFGALDALTRMQMQGFLEGLWTQNRWSSLLITHDVREAVLLSDRIYVLSARPGRVIGEFDVALDRPRIGSAGLAAAASAIEAQILDLLLNTNPDAKDIVS